MEVVFAKPMFRALVAINAKMDFITWMSIILTDVLFAIVLELRLNANQAIGDLK
jgi:amino acid permease